MAQTNEPNDYTSFFTNAMNQNPFKDAFAKNPFGAMKTPTIDTDAAMAFHRKNIDAVNEAQQVTTEAVRTLIQIQTQLSKELLEGLASYAKTATNPGSPQNQGTPMEAWSKQCESTASHGKEIIKTINATAKKVADTFSNRMNDCLDETSTSARSSCATSKPTAPTTQKK